MSQGEQNGNPTTSTPIPLPEVSSIAADSKPVSKGIRMSSILQGLLDEHKAQSLIVASLKEEINYLKQNPALYFQSRKRFLYHAYTQTLSKCQAQMKFDVQLDASYAFTDKEVGVVFGHIYQINPNEALNENFTFERAKMVNKTATERVAKWQILDTLPEGHSTTLMDIGKRVLKGLVGAVDIPTPLVIEDTEHLVQLAKELQSEEARLRSDFPAATKVMEHDDESRPINNEGIVENGHESESSGVLIEKEESGTPGSDGPSGDPAKSLQTVESMSPESPEKCARDSQDTVSGTAKTAKTGT